MTYGPFGQRHLDGLGVRSCVEILCLLLLMIPSCTSRMPPSAVPAPPGAALLAPCPPSPNCVSSQATDSEHHVDPLRILGDPSQAMDDLRRIIESMPRTRIVAANNAELHAEFRSRIFRFVDDVDLRLDGRVVQIRSASRTGYSDFGVNRARVEDIRRAFASQAAARAD